MASPSGNLDLIVRNGWVVDGSGNPWFRADVGVQNGRIAYIDGLQDATATTIDAGGLVVSPGFIDIHNHSDTRALVKPTCDSHVMQGVTTLLTGNCGYSGAPLSDETGGRTTFGDESENVRLLATQGVRWRRFSEYLTQVQKRGLSVNLGSLVGHGAVRALAMGWEDRAPASAEMERMKALVTQAMGEGAFGLSSGLNYAPGCFANTGELVELSKVVASLGGFHSIHIRDERNNQEYRKSVLECIEIGERSGAPIQISHLETHYPNGGMQPEVLRLLDDARARGVDVLCDVPPTYFSTGGLSTVLPHWVKEGGFAAMLARLRDPAIRRRVREDMTSERGTDGLLLLKGHWDQLWVAESLSNPQFSGKTLAEIAAAMGQEPSLDIVCELLLREEGEMRANTAAHDEGDIQAIVAHPLSMIESDAGVSVSQKAMVNPRTYGAFPTTFRRYVRGEMLPNELQGPGKKILTLQEAVRKMTSMPAQRMGLRDRGFVREGMWADLVIFNPDTIADRATGSDPHQYPVGIDYVLVNGQVVVDKGKHTGKAAGQALRHA